MRENVLKIADAEKSFKQTKALKGLNLSLSKGDFCGFVGPNGAGKTTAIHCVLNLLKADGGSFSTINKEDIGFMDGESNFPEKLKVKDVLSASASLYHCKSKERAAELCSLLDLDPEKRIRELSLGNRKKVGIVCALQHNPKLLILDEPTNGLDPLIQTVFFELLKEENKKGVTILLSSHNLRDVEKYCKEVVFIREGKIILKSNPSLLDANRIYKIRLNGIKKIMDSAFEKAEEPDAWYYSGSAAQMMEKLSRMDLNNLKDIEIIRPDMEEQFLHLYGDNHDAV